MGIKRTGITYTPSFTLAEAANVNGAPKEDIDDRTKKIDEAEAKAKAEKELKEEESDKKLQELSQKINSREAKMFKINTLYEKGINMVFKHIIFECYRRSLVLDQDFINANRPALEAYVSDFIDGNGGVKLLEGKENRLAKSIKAVCEATVNKVTMRKLNEAKNESITADDIDFDLDEKEKEDLSNDIDNLSVDQIAALVRDKVVQVVMDEKKSAAKKEEAIKSAEEDIVADDSIESEEDLEKKKELADAVEKEKSPMHEYTLFGAIMKRSYHQLLEKAETVPDVAEMNEYDASEDEGELEFKDEEEQEELDDSFKDSGDSIADKALAESITEYTMLEMMNTMSLITLNRTQIKEMAIDIAYGLNKK